LHTRYNTGIDEDVCWRRRRRSRSRKRKRLGTEFDLAGAGAAVPLRAWIGLIRSGLAQALAPGPVTRLRLFFIYSLLFNIIWFMDVDT
jgi:hypothetical protein